jgi:hypothetical protein
MTMTGRSEMSEPRWTCTRVQLTDAIAGIKASVRVSGPAAGMVNAESMADVILEQLPRLPGDAVTVSRADVWLAVGALQVSGWANAPLAALADRLAAAAGDARREAQQAPGATEATGPVSPDPGVVSEALRAAGDSP